MGLYLLIIKLTNLYEVPKERIRDVFGCVMDASAKSLFWVIQVSTTIRDLQVLAY